MLVDQFLETFGRAWLDLRFRTATFNTIIDACDIRLRGWGIDCGMVPCDHRVKGESFGLVVGWSRVECCRARC